MADIHFVVSHAFEQPAQRVWDALIDWKAHEAWIPMTRVEIHDTDATAIGSTFTAWTGPGRLALEDRMRVAGCVWDEATGSGSCAVDKLGPVLDGEAHFTVTPRGRGSVVEWTENVAIGWLPKLLAPPVAWIGAAGFRLGMRRLSRLLGKTDSGS